MFAMIATGGKQVKVEPGRYYHIELLPEEGGAEVVFDRVMCIHDGDSTTVGHPYIVGAKVIAEVLHHEKDDKVRIIKFRRRKSSMTRTGFRAIKTVVMIKEIEHTKSEEKTTAKATQE
jgi:large subunit ribosomal protein L21